jgi:hypothetical protein
MYRITYEQGNGYRCNCCRNTYEVTEDLKTEEEVMAWLVTHEANKTHPIQEDDDDRQVYSIEKEIGVDIRGQFVVDPAKVHEETIRRELADEAKRVEAEAKKKKMTVAKFEQSELKEYKRLREKFEGKTP